jgi:LEA14-like dessication related protein
VQNPNKQDLTIRGMTYGLSIEGINLLSGANHQVPVLIGMQETPVTLELSADMIQALRLIEHFSRHGLNENVNYQFTAVIDFSAWLPSMQIDKKGILPLSGKK